MALGPLLLNIFTLRRHLTSSRLSVLFSDTHHAHDVGLGDEVSDRVRQRVAEVDSPVVDAECGSAQLRREVVGQQRGGERRAAGLAEADAEPQCGQLPVLLGEPGQHHTRGPDQQTRAEQQLQGQKEQGVRWSTITRNTIQVSFDDRRLGRVQRVT